MRVSAIVGLCLLSTYALADLTVYTDALASGWDDWSWASTRNLSATANPARGSSISFLATDNWAGLNLHFLNTPFQVTAYINLSFSVNGGSFDISAGQYQVYLYNSSGAASNPVKLAAFNATSWTRQNASISSFNVGSQAIYGVAIQVITTGPKSTIYIDDISFVSAVPTVAPTTSPAVTSASTTTKAAASAPTTTKPVTSAPTTTRASTTVPPATTKAPTSAPTTTPATATTKAPTAAPTTTPAPATTKAPTAAPTTTAPPATTKAPTAAPTTSAPTTTKAATAAPTTTAPPATTKAPTSAPTSPADPNVNGLFTNTQTGQGTYYGPSSGGTCTLDTNLPSTGSNGIYTKVALNNVQWFGSELCGGCALINGTRIGSGTKPIEGPYVVFIADKCPECKTGDLDLAMTGDGRWGISWTLVPCSPIGNLQYAWQGGVNQYYIKLQIRNHMYPIFKVAVQQGTDTYVDLARSDDNFWLDGATKVAKPLVFPMKLKITAVNGKVVYDQVSNQAENNVIINGNAQFN